MATSNAAAEAERRLRLGAEELIAGAPTMAPDDALAGLADVEARALALAGAGIVDGAIAMGVVVATVDALAVRRVAWLEPVAADLDPTRLHEAVGSSRPELRSVVAVASGSVAVWDDRVEARLVDAPAIVGTRSEIADLLGVDLGRGVEGSIVEVSTVAAAADTYLDRFEAWCAGEARRNIEDLGALNRLRRRLVVAAEALGAPTEVVDRFDALVASLPGRASTSSLIEVVPVARKAGDRWLLSIERWSDHWRLVVAGRLGRETWTAVDAGGRSYGGAVVGGGVVRFDPELGHLPLSITWAPDGSPAADTVELDR